MILFGMGALFKLSYFIYPLAAAGAVVLYILTGKGFKQELREQRKFLYGFIFSSAAVIGWAFIFWKPEQHSAEARSFTTGLIQPLRPFKQEQSIGKKSSRARTGSTGRGSRLPSHKARRTFAAKRSGWRVRHRSRETCSTRPP